MFLLKHNLFYHPEEVVDKGADKGEKTHDEVVKLLGEEVDDKEEKLELDEKKEEKEEKEEEEEEEEEDEEKDELEELEDEIEEPDDEKLELITPVPRREILAKYPKLFKEFPHLEKAYYRERAFTELLPTIDDAREAVEAKSMFDKFDADISKGDLEKTIKAVKAAGDEAFNKMVDDYLPNLFKADKGSYHHVVGNIVKMTVNGMLNEAKASKNAELEEAANILNHFIFGTTEVLPTTKLSKDKPDNTEEERISKREEEFNRKRFEESRDGINTKVSNVLKATIEGNIDPKDSMSPYVKRNAIRDCQEQIEDLLSKDKRLSTILDKLWVNASKEDFSRASLDRIKSAYLSVSKTLLPAAIKKARTEAMKGLGASKKVKDEDEEESPSKRGSVPVGRAASSRSNVNESPREKAKKLPAGGVDYHEYLSK